MATRAVIKVEGIDFAQVYKHWDGDPESTLPFLKFFNEKFTKERGDDPTYKFAQLLRATSKYGDTYNLDPSEDTGYGVCPFDTDLGQEYEYLLKADGTVEIL